MNKDLSHKSSSKRHVLIVVFFAIFSDMLLYGLAGPVLPTYMNNLGASQVEIGLLFTVYAFALLISAPIFGLVSDKIGNRKTPMIWAAIGMLLACVLFIFAKNYWILLIARTIQGFTGGIMWTVGLAFIADTNPIPEERTKAMGIALSGQALGTFLGPTLGGWLYQFGGYTLPFFFAIIITCIDATLRLSVKEDKGKSNAKIISPSALLKNKEMLLVSSIILIGASVAPIMYSTLTIHMQDTLNVELGVVGSIFMVPPIAYATISPFIVNFTTRIGYFKTMIIGVAMMSIALPLLALPTTVFSQILSALFIGLSMGTVLVPAASYITILSNKEGCTHGVSYAIYNTAYSVGMFIGPIVGSISTSLVGVRMSYLIIGSGIFLYMLILIIVTKKPAHL